MMKGEKAETCRVIIVRKRVVLIQNPKKEKSRKGPCKEELEET